MKIRSRSISHVPILMASLALGFVMLACNMPYLAGQGDQVERELAAELGQSFGPAVTDVRLEGASLALAYTPPLLQAQETSAANLVRLMEIGAVKAARVELVRVEVVQAGVPVLAVSGSAKDARLLADGRLTMEAFLSGLAYADLRPVELALQQELARLGVRVWAVRYQNGILELYFWQPEIDFDPGAGAELAADLGTGGSNGARGRAGDPARRPVGPARPAGHGADGTGAELPSRRPFPGRIPAGPRSAGRVIE